ncbi:J domain-containing protein [Halosolutus amylolyticus]|uniref:J domain-containing protein n=1 Tax=Halosolutus amylolyticus TaxID=2932267 RepID=A0ABD5PMH8_9EURY|nr:J domain-containing protein [Halosolutus amylolyticus]
MGETYYDVLGVDREATQDEIRSAYRDRVLETHPDHNDASDAADQFRRVSTAESVLTDATERARYDRLGHESYVRLAQGDADDSTVEDHDDRAGSSSTTGTERATSRTTNRRQRTRERGAWSDSTGRADHGTDRSDGPSHHAGQRARRQRRTSNRRSAGEWPFDDDRERTASHAGGTGSTTTAEAKTETGTVTAATGSGTKTAMAADRSTHDDAEFSYAVHDWTDEVDLNPDGHSLDQPTIVGLGAVTVLYPLFVYASLTPVFSLLTNLVVATCTLLLVGYVLTFPRVATVAFGGWSVLLPIGLFAGPIDPVSPFGLLAIACCWIPFAYAVAVRWALRP